MWSDQPHLAVRPNVELIFGIWPEISNARLALIDIKVNNQALLRTGIGPVSIGTPCIIITICQNAFVIMQY